MLNKNRRRWLAWFLSMAMVSPLAQAAGPEHPKPLRFGSVAMDIPAVMYRRLTPLTDYLSKALGRPVTLVLSPNMPAAIEAVATGAVDIAYLTPVAYLRAHATGNVRVLVKTVTQGKASFQLMIIVPEKSPMRTVKDLAGRSFAFGDRAAVLQRAVVVGAGMPLEQLGDYKFLGHYDNIVRGVLNGDFDAGIVKDTMAFKWRGQGVRILYASPHLPPYNIAIAAHVDAATAEQLRNALLALRASNPDEAPVIKALDKNYDGFARTGDNEYDIIRQLTKPFE